MAQDRTSGFDMLVQISETELNTQLATAFLAGTIFPTSLSMPFNAGGATGTVDLNFGTPTADLDRPRPRMGLTVPFVSSQLQILTPLPLPPIPISGTIEIVDSIEMITEAGNQRAVMDFNSGAPSVAVTFDPPTASNLAPLLTATGLSIVQLQNLTAGMVVTTLQADVGRVDLTLPIPVVDDSDPTTVFDIDVTTVNDPTSADRDCLAFGVRMSNEAGGNINNVATSFIPPGSSSMVMMSNFWLLAKVMRPRLAAAVGTGVGSFDTPLRLNTSIPAPGGSGTLTMLEARVIGNRIRVDGRAIDSGTGWSAVADFNFFIDLGFSGGQLTVTATTPSVSTDVDLEWWVWLASLGLGGLFGGIIGVIVAAIVLAIVEAVAEGIANGMIGSSLSGALAGLSPVPLGPVGAGLSMTAVILDDLELRSTIIPGITIPVKSQGIQIRPGAFAIDLDSGAVASGATSNSDLLWDPQRGFATNGPARLQRTGLSYPSVSALQIARLALAGTYVPAGLVPQSFPPGSPFISTQSVVLGVRTGEGRLAKVRAFRSLSHGGAIWIEWTTWNTPTPSLEIRPQWSVLERGPVEEYITSDCSFCKRYEVSRCGIFEAVPRLLAYPLDIQWCFCGQVLEPGRGTIQMAHGPLEYKTEGRRLFLETELGQSIDCELCVSVIDARGQELFTCVGVRQAGVHTECKRCDPKKPSVRYEHLPIAAALQEWRPLVALAAADEPPP